MSVADAFVFASGGDAVPGGYNGSLYLRDTEDRTVGILDYQICTDPRWDDGTVLIAMIEVPEAERRKGRGTALIQRLQDEFPERRIDWGYMTPEGAALRRSWESRRQPARILSRPGHRMLTR